MKKLAALLLGILSISALASPDKVGPMVQHPAVSPVSSEIAFSADFDGPSRIWISGIDGTRLRKLSLSGSRTDEVGPSWSPDGRRIAYVALTGSGSEIWVMQADGSYPQRLTSFGVISETPVWSPDGQRIVFVSDKDGTKDIWSMNADGSRPVKLLVSNAQENDPRFSPDGRQLVFSRTDGDSASIMIMNADGSGLRTLTTGNFHDWEPNWGPQGIVFSSDRSGPSAWKLWMIQPDGSGLREIGDVSAHDPVWLPDGRIVFAGGPSSRALSVLSVLNPATAMTQVVVDVQGFHVGVDVRPGKTTNRINPASGGRVTVSILSTRTFDATSGVVQNTLTFGRRGDEPSFSHCVKPHKDVNGDGLPDLSCRFFTRRAGFQNGNTTAILRFLDARGHPREGRDSITTGPEEDPDDLKD